MANILVLGTLLLALQGLVGQTIIVPADRSATYTVVATERLENGHIEITTQRASSYGISYARREVNCSRRQSRYLGEGDTVAEASRDRPHNWASWVTGSSTAAVSTWACSQSGPEFHGEYSDWRVFTRNSDDGLVCYTLSRPRDSTPQTLAHGNVYFLVSSWQSGVLVEQPNLLVGYELRPNSPLQIRLDTSGACPPDLSGKSGECRDVFSLFSDGQEAFLDNLSDEPSLIREMRLGSTMRVTGTTADGVATAYEFSLSGITAALQRVSALCS
jgi:hypothetical protein